MAEALREVERLNDRIPPQVPKARVAVQVRRDLVQVDRAVLVDLVAA